MTPPFFTTTPAPPPEPVAASSEVASQHIGGDRLGEYLLTIYTDGTHEICWRARQWESWNAPIKLTAVDQ